MIVHTNVHNLINEHCQIEKLQIERKIAQTK